MCGTGRPSAMRDKTHLDCERCIETMHSGYSQPSIPTRSGRQALPCRATAHQRNNRPPESTRRYRSQVLEHDDVAGREQAWLAAILAKDLVLLDSFLAEEFVYTASNHGRRNRQEWLDSIPEYQFNRLELLDTTVDSYGDVAVVHARIRQDATLAGQVRVGVFLITDVWVRREGSWRVVSRTSVSEPLAPGAHPGAAG